MKGTFVYALPCAIVQLLFARVAATSISPVVFAPSQYWEGDDGTWSTFSIRVGNPEQVVRVHPSTSGYNVITVLPGGCNTTSDYKACTTARGGIFDPSGSKTWQDEGLFGVGMQANLGYNSVNGDFGLDKVGLGITENPNVTFANQVIGGVVTNDFYIGSFGLGTQPTNFTNFAEPHESFFTSLWSGNNTPSYTWSYTAGAKYENTGVLGSLIFGGYDSERFTPNNLTIPMSPDVSRDLVVGLQSITASYSAGSKLLMPSGGILTFVDSTLPYIWLPVDACKAFENTFGLVWNSTSELYLINDTLHNTLSKMNPSFTFTIGTSKAGGETVDLVLSYASFDLTISSPLVSNATRYFPLKRAANDTQYTLGRAFLQETYLTVDYERNNFSLSQAVFPEGTPSNIVTILSKADAAVATANSTTPASGSGGGTDRASSSSGISGGAIGGIVVGAVALIALLGALLFFLRKKRKWPFKTPATELDGSSAEDNKEAPAVPPTENEETDYTVDTAADPLHPKTPTAAEAMSSPLSEMADVHPIAGYFAKAGRHEMAATEPAAGELPTPGDELHEMFDESVYREMHSATSSQARPLPGSRAMNGVQPFSWMETEAHDVPENVPPGYETVDSNGDQIRPAMSPNTPERETNKEER